MIRGFCWSKVRRRLMKDKKIREEQSTLFQPDKFGNLELSKKSKRFQKRLSPIASGVRVTSDLTMHLQSQHVLSGWRSVVNVTDVNVGIRTDCGADLMLRRPWPRTAGTEYGAILHWIHNTIVTVTLCGLWATSLCGPTYHTQKLLMGWRRLIPRSWNMDRIRIPLMFFSRLN